MIGVRDPSRTIIKATKVIFKVFGIVVEDHWLPEICEREEVGGFGCEKKDIKIPQTINNNK